MKKNPKTAEAPYYKINVITLIPLLHRILSYYNAKICSVYWIFLYEIINCIVANQQQDTFPLKLYASTIKYNHCEWQKSFETLYFPSQFPSTPECSSLSKVNDSRFYCPLMFFFFLCQEESRMEQHVISHFSRSSRMVNCCKLENEIRVMFVVWFSLNGDTARLPFRESLLWDKIANNDFR